MERHEQLGFTVWFTGLSGSGKTTLARGLESRLRGLGIRVEVLDGDEIRSCLSHELGFSRAHREANIRRVGYVAKLLTRNSVVVVAALISPYRESRDFNRTQLGRFVEVYCQCPLAVAEGRDVKGLYEKARKGELKDFTGINDPYEMPLNPEVIVNTGQESIDESLEKIWRVLKQMEFIDDMNARLGLPDSNGPIVLENKFSASRRAIE
jgi:adenylyl-sulfate kinase